MVDIIVCGSAQARWPTGYSSMWCVQGTGGCRAESFPGVVVGNELGQVAGPCKVRRISRAKWEPPLVILKSQFHAFLLFVSCDCYNKLPQTWWVETTEIYSVTVLEARSPQWVSLGWNQSVSRPCCVRRLWGESLPCCLQFLMAASIL